MLRLGNAFPPDSQHCGQALKLLAGWAQPPGLNCANNLMNNPRVEAELRLRKAARLSPFTQRSNLQHFSPPHPKKKMKKGPTSNSYSLA
jgi:hypothetical protein